MRGNKAAFFSAVFCAVLFSATVPNPAAGEPAVVFGELKFGDTEKAVKEKMVRMFALKDFKRYHPYPIGSDRYRFIFKYDAAGLLRQVRIYSSNKPLREYRLRIKAYWQDLDAFATRHYGEGVGAMPHLTDLKLRQIDFTKHWTRDRLQADLGIVAGEYGYYVLLVITERSA